MTIKASRSEDVYSGFPHYEREQAVYVSLLRKFCRARLLIASTCLGASFAALDDTMYTTFGSSATYSVVNYLGFFTEQGLNIKTMTIPNSTHRHIQLLAGSYDVITGTIDNAVGMRFNSGKDLTIIGQLDSGSGLVLATLPSSTNVLELPGKPLIVDSATSGYGYALERILNLDGLRLENGDYTFNLSVQPVITPREFRSKLDLEIQAGAHELHLC